jgi:hypothetical protein
MNRTETNTHLNRVYKSTRPQVHFLFPTSLAVDGEGNILIVDSYFHIIRRLDMAAHDVTTLIGASNAFWSVVGLSGIGDGTIETTQLNYPVGIAIDNSGNVLIADTETNIIRIIYGSSDTPHGPDRTPFVSSSSPGTFKGRLAALRAKLHRSEAEHNKLQERLHDIAVVRDREADALRALEIEFAGFRNRIATEGVDHLDTAHVYELLCLLDVTTVTLAMLEHQEVTGATIVHVTEGQMRDVFKMQRFGDRRRLSGALKALANREGFPSPLTEQPGALGWGTAEVGEWLEREGFPELAEPFAVEGIDGPCLLGLQTNDFDAFSKKLTIGEISRFRVPLDALKAVTREEQAVLRRVD